MQGCEYQTQATSVEVKTLLFLMLLNVSVVSFLDLCVCFLQAYGVGGMRKRQEPPAIEDRDKPYVCDSEPSIFYVFISASPFSYLTYNILEI